MLMSNEDFALYLTQILGTTLVLDDGTRVKPIYIAWSDLTVGQYEMALQGIKRAAIDELTRLKAHERLRFEFNEIPDDLNSLLMDLAGPGNKCIDWAEIDMEEE